MLIKPVHATPMTTRSRVVLEIASELVADRNQRYNQAKVLLRVQGADDWPLALFGSSTIEGVDAIAKREVALAIINPSSALTLAYRGKGIFDRPQPVRTIGVIPSYDHLVLAVRPDTGITSFEEIPNKRFPLKIAGRGQKDHWLHYMIDDVMKAAGFSREDVISWGGEYTQEGLLPYPNGPKFADFVSGKCNAIFDEASNVWVDEAIEAGMTILPLAESTVQKLEVMGYRRAWLRQKEFPRLKQDLLTLDFSGWPIFVHEDEDDELITRICKALDDRKHLIPWQGEGPLPLHMMCRDTIDTPMDVPMHPAAEKFWIQRGYLP
ncbi:MAG TPA: TAXI family TRAP transporter solute-binding subunit [Alphaproteobacteria bacterium]|jgi:hypothetical protein